MLIQESIKKSQRKLNSETENFDTRSNLSLGNSVVKAELNRKKIDNIEYDNVAALDLDKQYFQRRIAAEMSHLHESPDNEVLLLRVGDIYASNGKPDKAKQFYLKAFKINTNNAVIARKLAEIYLMKNKPDKADQLLDMIQEDGDSYLTHIHLIAKMIREDYEGATRIGSKINQDVANYYEVVNTLGLIDVSQGNFSDAKIRFEKSIQLNPAYAPAKSNLALVYQGQGDELKAEEIFREVIDEHPTFVNAYHNMFNLLIAKDKLEDALELMLSIRHLATPLNEIQFRIAWTQMTLGRFKDAINEYSLVLEQLPGNPATLNNIGHCYASLGDNSKAYSNFKQAVRPKKGVILGVAYRNFMILSDRVGKIEDSRRIADDILRVYPDDVAALVYRGDRFAHEEKWERAKNDLERAYKEKPPLISLYLNLSLVYADVYPDYEKGLEVCKYVLDNAEKIDRYEEIFNNLIHLKLVNGKTDTEEYTKLLSHQNPVSLSTLALAELVKDNYDNAAALYDDAISFARESFKDKVIQRKNYDLGTYLLEKADNARAIEFLKAAANNKLNGFKYIRDNAKLAIQSIESVEA